MSHHRFLYKRGSILFLLLVGMFLAAPVAWAQGDIPSKVMESLRAKFPKAEIDHWTREEEGGIVLYDIEFKQGGRKFEADVQEDGVIQNWEKAVASEDLPAAVKQSVQEKYPGSTMKETMEITAVKDGQDELEGYEIVLQTAAGKSIEVTLAPDGKILEESGDG